MSQTITFERWEGNHPRLQCVWNDELRFFPNEEAARAWAHRQGFRAVFPETAVAELRGVAYQFLGITGEEQA
ncbi:hypothetical protein [Paraburkholderia tagetis]|uniref:Uncharacterized protein n=1 Tax=Paraburkholderia tagetis TaxID=2913261 RepID=A0A9X1RKQ7_9BURK|nr:hypothetical protein [Paraburkholderia tagetis]MCG5072260.1 hypothetical protein [Paraburkholderia tagetis]